MSRQRKRFDWQAIHAELNRRVATAGSTVDDDPERVRRLLEERSLALAAVLGDASVRRPLTRLLVFRLGQEQYGLRLDDAREVTGLSRYATIPGAGSGILGIVNWRGEFVVVFDLPSLLGVAVPEDHARRRVIVLRGDQPMGLAVDSVERTVEVDLTSLQPRDRLRLKRAELFRGATSESVLVFAEDSLRARLDEELRAA